MLVLVIVSLVLIYFIYQRITTPPNLPPGPIQIPIVGYLPFIQSALHVVTGKLAQRYGPISCVTVGSRRVVVLSSLDAMKQAVKQETLMYSRFLESPIYDHLNISKNTGLLFSAGNAWKETRRFTLRNLRDFGFGKASLEGMIYGEISELVDHIRENAGRPMQLSNRFNLAIVNSLWSITAGQRFHQDDPEPQELVEKLNCVFGAVGFYGALAALFPVALSLGPIRKRLSTAGQAMLSIKSSMMDAVNAHRRNRTPGTESDFIHVYLERMSREQDPQSPFHGEEGLRNLESSLFDLFAAGTETTSTALRWMMLLMATHPDIQRKMQHHIDNVIPHGDEPSLEHRPLLPYIDAVISEMQRVSSMINFLIYRTPKETDVLGYTIPKDTLVVYDIYRVHRDGQYWQKPDGFHPEHFLNDDGSLRTCEAFIPFGIGESLARMELFLFTVTFLKHFTFEFPADRPRPSLEPQLLGATILAPQHYDIVAKLR